MKSSLTRISAAANGVCMSNERRKSCKWVSRKGQYSRRERMMRGRENDNRRWRRGKELNPGEEGNRAAKRPA